jgi:hypothetical protein
MALEGTNNMVFGSAHSLPLNDKRISFDDKTRTAMGWPDSFRTMYDYRNRIPTLYNRMFQLCIISLCADIEYFFKCLFIAVPIVHTKDRGFFQRFDHVISELLLQGITFSGLDYELEILSKAFQIRHICIHNFGIVDKAFAAKLDRPAIEGEFYIIGQEEYRPMFDSYKEILIHIDQWLSNQTQCNMKA